MKVLYTGPHDAVTVPLPGGGSEIVEQGGVLDTTDTHAEGLLEQPENWQRAAATAGTAAKTKAPASAGGGES